MKETKEETYAQIARKISEIPIDKHGSSYEWEELVEKLCASEDAGLQEIGHKEHDELEQTHTKHEEKQG
mgnify:CR=1 FL=1